MVLLMFVSLYTSRVILEVLGVEDFGIYNVVGGFVSILGFFISSLTNACQRYLNIGLGSNDIDKTRIYFRQSFTILLFFSIFVLVVGETIGLWFVMNKLVIPEHRHFAAFWVYQFSLVSIICAIIQVVFLAAIIAHEKMTIYAYLGLFEGITRLGIAFLLSYLNSDHLILYGALSTVNSILILFFHIGYSYHKFDICSVRLIWEKELANKMAKFISANIFGCFAWSAGVQGTNIILNIFFGPAVNAARGVAVQVSSIVNKFTDSVMTAVKPQIIKSYAADDVSYMHMLIMKVSKLAFFISVLIAMPILFGTEFLLEFWLKKVPEFTVEFSRLVIIEAFAQVLITPLWIAANATGDIKRNQVYGRLFTLMSLPLSYIALTLFYNPIIAIAICTSMNYLYWCYCVYDIKIQINLSVYKYFKAVVLPSIIIASILIIVGLIIKSFYYENGVIQFIITSLAIEIVGICVAFLLMTKGERDMINKAIARFLHKKN